MEITILNHNFSHSFWKIIDWIYPPTCCGCGKVGYRFCNECLEQVEILNNSICVCCGEIRAEKGLCLRCKNEQPYFKSLRSWGIFNGPLRDAVHSLKYHRDLGLGDFFAPFLAKIIYKENWQFDIIIPAPLSKDRLKERKYNQAEILAKPLANSLGIPNISSSLVRIKNTRSQVGLSLQQRKSNVENAFIANPEILNSKRVLLVDDVTTTGSTIDACSKALIIAGAKTVFGLTLARAIRLTDQFIRV